MKMQAPSIQNQAPQGRGIDDKPVSAQHESEWQQGLTADEIELAATFLHFLYQCEERFAKKQLDS